MRQIVLLLVIFIFSVVTFAQQSSITFRHLNDNNGLSNNSVLSICQDHKGFIWFGTRYGLNRYDGHEFKIFNPILNDSTSISNSHINKIFEDNHNNLWIATKNGLNLYNRDKEQFVNVELIKDSIHFVNVYITNIAEDNDNQIWIISPEGVGKITYW